MKCVQKHFLKENLYVLQVFLCAVISQPVCTHTCTQLRGNIALNVISFQRVNLSLISQIYNFTCML